MTSDPRRIELLEKLFEHVWNQMCTYESDDPKYAYVSYDDLIVQENICVAIEELT